MDYIATDSSSIKNTECAFTELFALLKFQTISGETPILGYRESALMAMQEHIDNAMDVLFRGQQALGLIVDIVAQDYPNNYHELNNIGFFISLISNLTAALYVLRVDADYMLRQHNNVKSKVSSTNIKHS